MDNREPANGVNTRNTIRQSSRNVRRTGDGTAPVDQPGRNGLAGLHGKASPPQRNGAGSTDGKDTAGCRSGQPTRLWITKSVRNFETLRVRNEQALPIGDQDSQAPATGPPRGSAPAGCRAIRGRSGQPADPRTAASRWPPTPGRPCTEPVAHRLPAAHADGLPDLPHRRRPAVIGDVTADATQDPLLGGSEAVDAARRSGRVAGVVEAAHHARTARWARVAGARVVQRPAGGPAPQLDHQDDAVVRLFRPPARDVEQQTVQRTTDQFGVGRARERWRRATCSASARSAAPVGHGSHSQSRSPGLQGGRP